MQKHQQHQQKHQQHRLFEGLRAGDLKDMMSDVFTVDQYKSKMGNDEEIIVIAFKSVDKFPAIDLMEFIEKGYPFVLDADMSAGEEQDGDYRVFVEIERTGKAAYDVEELLQGVGRLCKVDNWKFKYFRDHEEYEFSKDEFIRCVPLEVEAYNERVKSQKMEDAGSVLDQGPAAVADIDESNNLTIRKQYAGDITVQLEAIGDYRTLEAGLKGALQLDESSNGQVLFLEKYLGNYEIHKINNKFILKNGDKAMIFRKDIW
jgi:hypothetical protein